MQANKHFEQYQRMIYAYAWKVSKSDHLPVDDLISQGYLIYVEALNSFDITKAMFSTYLYGRLRTLYDYAKTQKRQWPTQILDNTGIVDSFFDTKKIEDENYILKKIQEAANFVSEDALAILDWLLGRDWDFSENLLNKKRPTLSSTLRHFVDQGWQPIKVKNCWAELANWWTTAKFSF
jgi:RNA polymerase sigma factor (sigma-70 family)